MSNDDAVETIYKLYGLLSKIDDRKLKEDIEDQIINLCDQLKFSMVMDRVKEKKTNEK
jgi:hypothetical protein|tara:strand:+ start:481 stop:654 length:174 start_codon:yes stop_codon:yes gene_type:complete